MVCSPERTSAFLKDLHLEVCIHLILGGSNSDSCGSICIKDMEIPGINLGKSANIMSHVFH